MPRLHAGVRSQVIEAAVRNVASALAQPRRGRATCFSEADTPMTRGDEDKLRKRLLAAADDREALRLSTAHLVRPTTGPLATPAEANQRSQRWDQQARRELARGWWDKHVGNDPDKVRMMGSREDFAETAASKTNSDEAIDELALDLAGDGVDPSPPIDRRRDLMNRLDELGVNTDKLASCPPQALAEILRLLGSKRELARKQQRTDRENADLDQGDLTGELDAFASVPSGIAPSTPGSGRTYRKAARYGERPRPIITGVPR